MSAVVIGWDCPTIEDPTSEKESLIHFRLSDFSLTCCLSDDDSFGVVCTGWLPSNEILENGTSYGNLPKSRRWNLAALGRVPWWQNEIDQADGKEGQKVGPMTGSVRRFCGLDAKTAFVGKLWATLFCFFSMCPCLCLFMIMTATGKNFINQHASFQRTGIVCR